jgi:hypothetical protein
VRETKKMDFCASPVLKRKATLAVRLFATALASALVLSAETISSARVSREQSVDKQAAVIEKTLNKNTERQAFSELEALDCPAVPAIIQRMDDRRTLPHRYIGVRNKSPNAFEGITHGRPQRVVNALVVIVSQLTGREFGFISNSATAAERTKTIQGCRDFLG